MKPPVWTNGFLFFADVPAGGVVRVRLPLKESRLTLSGSVHINPIRVALRGDSVAAMDSFGSELTFFQPFD